MYFFPSFVSAYIFADWLLLFVLFLLTFSKTFCSRPLPSPPFPLRCLKEALRKYSVVPTVTRTNSEEIEAEGHTFPPRTTFMIAIQGVHNDPKYWKDPQKYDPTRFLKGPNSIQPFTFLPFIEGPRNCLGQYLALLESKIVLSLLFKEYEITIAGGMDGKKHRYMVPVIPQNGVVARLKKRKKMCP